MSSQPPDRQVDPAAALVEALVERLSRLNDREFADALADYVQVPNDEEKAAFRSPHLAERSHRATMENIRIVQAAIRQTRKAGRDTGDLTRMLAALESERHELGNVVRLVRLARGEGTSAPSPRGQAMEQLWEEVMAGDVKKGRGTEILHELRENLRAEKEGRKERRRAAREAQGLPVTPPRPPRKGAQTRRG